MDRQSMAFDLRVTRRARAALTEFFAQALDFTLAMSNTIAAGDPHG